MSKFNPNSKFNQKNIGKNLTFFMKFFEKKQPNSSSENYNDMVNKFNSKIKKIS